MREKKIIKLYRHSINKINASVLWATGLMQHEVLGRQGLSADSTKHLTYRIQNSAFLCYDDGRNTRWL